MKLELWASVFLLTIMAWWFLPELLRCLLCYFAWIIKHGEKIEKWLTVKRDLMQSKISKLDSNEADKNNG